MPLHTSGLIPYLVHLEKYDFPLKQIIDQLENNVVGITPDGPKGPKEKIKDGLISLIKKLTLLLFPYLLLDLKLNSVLGIILIAFPFNKFIAIWGKPLTIILKIHLSKIKLSFKMSLKD